MKRYLIFIMLVAAIFAGFSSCKDDNNLDDLRAEELTMLNDYMLENHSGVTPKASGLYFILTEDSGNDSTIRQGDRVEIAYTGTLLANGIVFDSNLDSLGRMYEPLTVTVGTGAVITGMDEGLTFMKNGDKAKMIIPSDLAYGATVKNGIPRFSTLIFDVEIKNHIRD